MTALLDLLGLALTGVFVVRLALQLARALGLRVRLDRRGPLGGGSTFGRRGAPSASVHMERDPVCGTFVVPERAVALDDGSRRVYFCSSACRDSYRARTA